MEIFQPGQRASLSRSFNAAEVRQFSTISRDENPIHFDEEYAATTRFKKCIVQGPLVASMIGGVLGSQLPGPGTIYIKQESAFVKPSFVGDTLTAWVEVTHVRTDKPVITLKTWVEDSAGEAVITGQAVVLFMPEA